jgi:hypothetical protein
VLVFVAVVAVCLTGIVGSAFFPSRARAEIGPPPAAPPISPAVTVLESPTHPSEAAWYTSRGVGLHWEGSPVSYSVGGWYPPGAKVNDVDVAGDVAYIVDGSIGLVMLEVGDRAHPAVLAEYTGAADLPGSARAFERVAVQGDYAYCAGYYYVFPDRHYFVAVVDVTDPSSPAIVNRLDLEATATGALLVRDGYVYMTSDNGAGEAWLDVVDARDPTQLVYAGGCEVPPGVGALGSSQMAFKDGFLYIPTDSGGQLTVADASDPSSPTVVTTLADDCVQPCVDGSLLFAFDHGSTSAVTSAVNVFDIADPQSVHLEGTMPTHPSSGPWLHATGCLVVSDQSLSRRYLFGNLELQWYDTYNGYWLDFTEIFDVTQPLPHAGLAGDLDVGTDYSSLCFANSSLFGGISILGGDANGLSIRHVGPDAYSYVLDQNPSGTPDTTPDGKQSGLGADHTLTAPGDGVYYFHVRAADHAGTWGPTVTRKVQIDGTAPTASDNADESWHQGGFTLNITGSDATSGFRRMYLSIDGKSPSGGYVYSPTVSPSFDTWKRGGGSGTHTVSYRVYDKAGNSTSLVTRTVKIDGKPPQTANDAPRDSTGAPVPQSQALTVNLTAADQAALSGVKETWWSLDGGGWTKGTSVSVPAVNGYHFVRYYSVDNAGNSESVKTCTVRMVVSAKALHRGLAARRT